MEIIARKKSGQAAIVIVVVTMMTILGVAVATSSQSRVNLRDTVYSTQAEQSITCAESGIEFALVDASIQNDIAVASGGVTLTSDPNQNTSILGGCDKYDAKIYNYPSGDPIPENHVSIPNLTENDVQQLNISGYTNGTAITVRFRAIENATDSGIALYQYYNGDQVQRVFLFCPIAGGPTPTDFIRLTVTGTGPAAYCEYSSMTAQAGTPRYLRIRAMQADNTVTVRNFSGNTGYFIESKGFSGPVERIINVYKFYSQLPAGFDEAMVSFGSGNIVDN